MFPGRRAPEPAGTECHALPVPDVPASSPPLDETARRILEILQHDGRTSYRAIAAEVGLSEAAVRQRVQRLLSSGVMQIVAVTDPLEVGLMRQAMVGICVDGDINEVAEALANVEGVDYVVITAGSFDLIVEIVCADDPSLLALLNDRIRVLPGVRSTETFMYLKLVKQTYTWGAQ